ncbi:MAG: phosphopantetheine-binding protein, partial [Pirellulaceae bacterium]|nr:phosphopantetheine-binding protein [Pirellulaceae bacterium]
MADLEQRLAQLTPLQRAVLALKETQQRLEAFERQRDEPIALVGMSCRFPGAANDTESFWRMLCDGVNAIREIPAERWDVDAFYDPDPAAPGKMNTRWGGFIEKIDEFDNHFFSISDREAMRIDPQHRLSLELTWEALENAGIPPSSLRGSLTGVFIGLSHSEYGMMLSTDMAQSDAYVGTGSAHCLVANRISFVYDFHGPSVMLDTACSSSLVAVHLACQAIRSGEAELAVAGGVNIILSPLATVNLTKAGFTSADGQVRAFAADASGYVRSEGGGLVVLKPLSAALRDHDRIYALIRGSAVNQNGCSNGLTAPSRPAQESVLRRAYAAAKLPPGLVQYVEAQGTGTRLGDAIEALALGSVLGEGRAPDQRCGIGSVKTNLGHLEAASGAASLIKVALALHHREIPPTLNFQSPSSDIPFAKLPLAVQDKLAPWPATNGPCLAGVSAFGFGGSNAHLVLTEAPAVPPQAEVTPTNEAHWLTLSARTEQALTAVSDRYLQFLRQPTSPAWNDICYTAAARRDHHDCRLALRAASAEEAAEFLERHLAGQSSSGILVGRKPYGRDAKVAFVFGAFDAAQHGGVRQAIARLPDWPEATVEVDTALSSVTGWTLSSALGDDAVWADAHRRLPATTALQLAFTNWCRTVGIAPAIVVGTGVGEIAAAAVAGIVSMADAFRWSAAVAQGDISSVARELRPAAARLPCLSAAQGKTMQGAELERDAWQRPLARTADWNATLAVLRQRQTDVALTVGEELAAISGGATRDILLVAIAADTTSGAGTESVTSAFGPLYCAGLSLCWNRLEAGGGRLVNVPLYPWQKHRLWVDCKAWLANASGRIGAPAKADEDSLPIVAGASTDTGSAAHAMAALEPAANAPLEYRTRPDLNTPYEAARTPFEEDLVLAWCEILKLDRVGVHDNFFELGGDSLQAMILHNALQDRLGEVVLGYLLFQSQTIDSLARYMRRYYPAAIRRLHPQEVCEETGEIAPAPASVGPQE